MRKYFAFPRLSVVLLFPVWVDSNLTGMTMICAIGIDLVDINRIEAALERLGARFLARLFSDAEIGRLPVDRAERALAVSSGFAAKEAVMKSLGRFFDGGVALRDIEIETGVDVMPAVRLPDRLISGLGGRQVRLSISCAELFAMAMAFIVEED